MTSCVPHLDLVILHFKEQTLEIFNNEGTSRDFKGAFHG